MLGFSGDTTSNAYEIHRAIIRLAKPKDRIFLFGFSRGAYTVRPSSRNVESAIARMQVAGAVFLTYKSLYYELLESVGGCGHAEKMREAFGPFPDDLPTSRSNELNDGGTCDF